MLLPPSVDGSAGASAHPGIRSRAPRRRTVLRWSLLLSTLACTEFGAPVTVERAALALPTSGAPAMVFATVRNTSGRPVRLSALEVEGTTRTSLQTTTAHRMPAGSAPAATMTLLSPVTSVLVEAGGTLHLAPGGYTGVIDALTRPLTRGDSVRFTVVLETGERASAMARVAAFAELDALLAGTSNGIAVPVDVPPSVAEGRALYASDGCAACHGTEGHGDGPVARTLNPAPRDFRDVRGYRNGTDEPAIAQTLATGIPGGGQMPLYAHLTLRERRSLALYLISLRLPTPETDR